jgi:hypothetical protein
VEARRSISSPGFLLWMLAGDTTHAIGSGGPAALPKSRYDELRGVMRPVLAAMKWGRVASGKSCLCAVFGFLSCLSTKSVSRYELRNMSEFVFSRTTKIYFVLF